jgi:hypothetical protein
MNLSGSKILFLLMVLLTTSILTSCSNEYESLMKEHYAEAVQQFNERLYFKDQKQSDRQLFIDSYTGRKNSTISTDDVQYNETGHFNFPYTANRKTYYKNTNYKNEYIVVNHLFIYEDIRGIWLPLSIITQTFKDGKDISSKEQDLWDEKNDWAEVFKKEHTSDEELEDLEGTIEKILEGEHLSDEENKEREELIDELEELIEKLD